MKPGDCINIPAEVKHWHGAAPDSWFSHLAVEVPGEETSNEWCESVTDEEYSRLKWFAKPYWYNWSKIFTNALTTHNSVVMISIIKRE